MIAAVIILLIKTSIVAVDETRHVIVTRFGKPVATFSTAGPHFKVPFYTCRVFDKRVRLYAPRPSEFLTSDKKNLVIDNYVCWRIADPVKFLLRVTDVPSAEMRLHDVVWSTVSAAVGATEMSSLISEDPQEVHIDALVDQVSKICKQRAMESYGIEIVDVRFRRITFPDQNKQSVFKRMRAERERIAKQYRAEGEEQALRIRAEADRERDKILSEAYREAQRLKGEGDAEATRIYAAAYGKDPAFFKLQRTLESYKKFLTQNTTVILSSDSELLKLLTSGRPSLK